MMPRYRKWASFGFVGTDTDYGVEEFNNEDEAARAAYDEAIQQVDAWAELVVGDDDDD